MSFLKVEQDLDIKGIADGEVAGAWNNAKQFVKVQADTATAAK